MAETAEAEVAPVEEEAAVLGGEEGREPVGQEEDTSSKTDLASLVPS